jgi:hypothetical protein
MISGFAGQVAHYSTAIGVKELSVFSPVKGSEASFDLTDWSFGTLRGAAAC